MAEPAILNDGKEHPSIELLERAYRQYWHEVCRAIRRTFGAGPPEPEDVAQAAFAKFAELSAPQSVANPRAFLHRMAHNFALDAYRRDRRFDIIIRDFGTLIGDARDFSPEDVMASQEELQRLDRVLDLLTEKERRALLLHRIDGLSFAEIARQMAITPSGARFLVVQGLDRCIEAIAEDEL